jgi:hypothetical protein
MLEKRLAQWYAADAGVNLDIAEREIVLTAASPKLLYKVCSRISISDCIERIRIDTSR